MADDVAGERSEKPTAKKLSEAVGNGDVLQSKELTTALVMMAGIAWLAITGPAMVSAVAGMLRGALRFDAKDIFDFAPGARGYGQLSEVAMPVGGVLLATYLAAIAAPAMLGSLGFRTSAFAPKASKLNPMKGISRIFGLQGVIELVKSLFKILLMGSVGIWIVWDRLTAIVAMGKSGLEPALADMGSMFILACIVMAGMMFLIAGFDIPMQIMQRGKRLAMSKQQVKEEHKESEGSPEAKGHIRQKQFEASKRSARKAMTEATVVITNPTHFSVALRYHPGKDQAPTVVARGRGDTALAIRELANEMAVPVLQFPELARSIYYTSRAGQLIEEQLYMAVASVLAFVFRIENKLASEMDRPVITVPDELRYDTEGRKIMN